MSFGPRVEIGCPAGFKLVATGKQIGDVISRLTPVGLPVRIAHPISWWFRKVHPGEEQ
jgi:hypothetical protein